MQPYLLTIQTKQTVDDSIGGVTTSWTNTGSLVGYIDLLTGTDLPISTQDNAFVQRSTHIAICPGAKSDQVSSADRIVDPNGVVYGITYVDDPGGLGNHLEIYLRHSGGTK